jgi:hypothetical protein
MSPQTISPPVLQPPGAGLPVFELALARIYFWWMCSAISQDSAMRRFKREGEKILSLAHRDCASADRQNYRD